MGIQQKRVRVLVAEDEPASQMLYREALKAEGYEVCVVRTGAEALDLIEKVPIAALVLDVRMPDMHGLELLEELRQRGYTIPTILCTAMAGAGESFEVQAYGVSAILVKPVDLDDLRTKVREALAEPPQTTEASDPK